MYPMVFIYTFCFHFSCWPNSSCRLTNVGYQVEIQTLIANKFRFGLIYDAASASEIFMLGIFIRIGPLFSVTFF